MLDTDTKRRIDTARDILVGKVPDPKSQVEQITIALIYKFMDDMDAESEELGGKRKFFTGEYSRFGWAKLMDPRLGGHEMLGLYAEGITTMPENSGVPPLFREVFKNAYLPYRDPETLKAFLKIINEFSYDHSERLGDAFEYLLSVLGSQGDAGQFRTPRHIIDFIVEIIDPKKTETVLDPACGTAGFLISSYKHILKANVDADGNSTLTPDERGRLAQNFTGYDISPDMVRLSLVNLYLHGFNDPHIYEYDTLTSEERWNDYASVILANPPFMSPKGGIKPHKRFSIQAKRSEVLFVDYMLEHLSPAGRAGIIVPEGIMFQGQGAYQDLRKMLLENALVAVVSLPAGCFNPYSAVKTSILILDKSLARQSDTIAFFKVENDGFGLGAQRRPFDKNDLPQVKAELGAYLRALRTQQPTADLQTTSGLIVPRNKIAANGEYNLSGERYREGGAKNHIFPLVMIAEVCSTSSGGTPLSGNTAYYEGGTIPWLRSGEVAQGEVFHTELSITKEGLRNSSAKMFPINTVLVAMYGATAGEIGILRVEAATNQAVCGITPDQRVSPDFLYLILKSNKPALIRLAGGGAQPNISQKIIREFKIPLPPLEVQKEIVAEIDAYQRVINGARAVTDNYRPHIPIHSEWPTANLGDICTLISGQHIDREDYNTDRVGVDYLTGPSDFGPKHPVATRWTSNPKVLAEKGDILMTVKGSGLGSVNILATTRAAISRQLMAIRVREADPEFVYSLLLGQFDHIQSLGGGAAIPGITREDVLGLKIPLPPLPTQQAIVAEIEAEQSLVAANRELITRFERKIQTTLGRIWGEEAPANPGD